VQSKPRGGCLIFDSCRTSSDSLSSVPCPRRGCGSTSGGTTHCPCLQAIDAYQVEDYRLSASMNVLNVAQSVVIYAGMAAGLLVCTKVCALLSASTLEGWALCMAACLSARALAEVALSTALPLPSALCLPPTGHRQRLADCGRCGALCDAHAAAVWPPQLLRHM
jgi:hypothetical protein